jgi:HK97 family phage portal protein
MRLFGYDFEFKASKPDKPSGDSLQRMAPTVIMPWEHGREIIPTEKYQALIAAYTSWTYICASKNSNAVAAAPLRLYVGKQTKNTKVIVKTVKLDRKHEERIRKQGNLIPYHRKAEEIEEVVEHPFLQVIKKVNPLINRFDLWDGTQLWLELTGNAYWYIWKDNLGVPQELWPLPPQYMKIVASKDKIIAGYVYQRAVQKIPFTDEEIIHFKFFSPTGSLYGTGPLAAVMDVVIDDRNIKTFESTLMKNMGRPEGILQSKEGISEVDFKRMKERWNQQYGGVNKAGKTIILENGLEYKPLTFTPREMNYVVGRKLNREEIAAAFGVPMSKLTTEAVNLANAYVGEHQYMQDTIEPRLRRIEETINEKLMPMYDENLFVAYDSVVPSDKTFELQERTSNLGSYITTVNEEREKMGLDKVAWGDIPLAQGGVAPLGSQPAAGPGGPGSEGVPGEEDEPGVAAIDAAAGEEDIPEDLTDEEIAAGIVALEGGKEKQTSEIIAKIIQRVREKLVSAQV